MQSVLGYISIHIYTVLKETHSIGNVFDIRAASITDHFISRIRPATLHMRRVPGKDHRGLIDKVDGQVLRCRRWFYKKYILQDSPPPTNSFHISYLRTTFKLK